MLLRNLSVDVQPVDKHPLGYDFRSAPVEGNLTRVVNPKKMMKNLKKLMLVFLIWQSFACFFIASPVPAENGDKLDPESLNPETVVLDIQEK